MVLLRVNELRGDAHSVSPFAYATLDDVARAEFVCYLLEVLRLPPEGEAGVAGNHREGTPQREVGDDVLRDTIREVLLLRITAHVCKRQNSNSRRFFG